MKGNIDKTGISIGSDPNKPHIFLDLDQTIISAEEHEEYEYHKNMKKACKFDFEDMDGYYLVFARPYLQKFLDYLFANFNVSVWTAASKDYALFIVDKMILTGAKNRTLQWIFFSYHCDVSKQNKKASKSLSMLWDFYNIDGITKSNTVILDDYDEVYNTQPDNCIIAEPFEFTNDGSEKDTFLKDLIPKLKVMVKNIKKGTDKPATYVNESNKT
jgi:TFIIF-interacting CTD phosphatase-like protein